MKRAFWVVALAPFASAGDSVNEDWAAKDVAVARRIVAALPAGETKLDDFLKKLDASSTDEDRGIGFGARRLRLALYGGHTTTWVTVIVWNDRVGPLEVFCYEGDAEVWAELRERIAAEYKGREPAIGEKGLRVRVGKAWEPEGFQEARGKTLGAHLLIDPADDVAEAYLLLLSPFSDLAYGSMQGEGGDKPDGRLAMEKLLAHEQGASLLEDALRGPNPEGRLYAAEGLLRLERKGRKLGEQARKDIEWVRKSDVKIHACSGCEMSWEPAATPLEEMLKDDA
jgi:hypothetical protein